MNALCAGIQSAHGFLNIANAVILAVALVMLARAAYLLALGWGDAETTRYVRGLFFKALGWIALAVVLNIIPGAACG